MQLEVGVVWRESEREQPLLWDRISERTKVAGTFQPKPAECHALQAPILIGPEHQKQAVGQAHPKTELRGAMTTAPKHGPIPGSALPYPAPAQRRAGAGRTRHRLILLLTAGTVCFAVVPIGRQLGAEQLQSRILNTLPSISSLRSFRVPGHSSTRDPPPPGQVRQTPSVDALKLPIRDRDSRRMRSGASRPADHV